MTCPEFLLCADSTSTFFSTLDPEKLTVIGLLFAVVIAFATGQLVPGFMFKGIIKDRDEWIDKYAQLSQAYSELAQEATKAISLKRRRDDRH